MNNKMDDVHTTLSGEHKHIIEQVNEVKATLAQMREAIATILDHTEKCSCNNDKH